MDWRWTGLVAMMCKATPFEKLACTIDTGTVAVRHVSGSHQIGRSLLPSIMSSFLVLVLVAVCAMDVNAMVSVETHLLSSSGPLVLSAVVLRSAREHLYKRV